MMPGDPKHRENMQTPHKKAMCWFEHRICVEPKMSPSQKVEMPLPAFVLVYVQFQHQNTSWWWISLFDLAAKEEVDSTVKQQY